MKRVLSFILLTVLLVTAVPATLFAASADTVQATENAVTVTDYDKLYITDGLEGLYTAFDTVEAAAYVTAGKWANKLDATGNTDATIVDTVGGTWTVGTKAGFGYTWAVADYSKTTLKAGVNLPASYASMPDFFVEASYTFHPLTDSTATNYYASVASFRLEHMAAVPFPAYSTTNANNRHCNRWILTGSGTISHGGTGSGTTLLSSGSVGSRYLMYWDIGFQNAYRANSNTVAGLTQYLYKDTTAENAIEGSTATYVTYDITYNTGRNVGTNNYANPANVTYDQYMGLSLTDTKVGHFSFFNNFPSEVYAIRVYDRVLTEAEKQHNHLIDLLAFYDVALPANMANNPALLDKSMAAEFYAYPFVSDDNDTGYDYTDVKKALEDAIAALTIYTLTISVSESDTPVPVVSGENYALPSAPAGAEGKTMMGWRIDNTAMAPGATVVVDGNKTVTAMLMAAVKIDDEVGVKVITETENDKLEEPLAAVRFTATVDRASYDALTLAGYFNILEQGILITPEAYVKGAGDFTMDALENYVLSKSVKATRAYLRVKTDGYFESAEDAYIVAGGFGNFSDVTEEKDPLFASVAYFLVDYNKDGAADSVIYGSYEEEKNIHVTGALVAALRATEPSDQRYEPIRDAYLAFLENDTAGRLPTLEDIRKLTAPVISLKEGANVVVTWEAITGAVGYVVTVNGVEKAMQTGCTYTLDDDGVYTVSVRAISEDPAYDSPDSEALTVEYGFDESTVVLRFAALSDVHVSSTQRGKKMADVMKVTAEKYDLSAILFAGDLTDAQTSNKQSTFRQMALFAEYAAEGNVKDLPLVWCLGNHDFPTLALTEDYTFTSDHKKVNYTFTTGTTAYDAALDIYENTSSTFFANNEAWPVEGTVPAGFRYSVIDGFSFIAIDYTHVTTDSLAWFKTQMDALVAEAPNKQIFITSHMPSNGSAQPAALTTFMKDYPQIVYISGHTHVPMQNNSNIKEREGFVEIVLGPGNHAEYGVNVSASAYNSYQMKQGAIVEVDAGGRIRVKALDYSFSDNGDGTYTSHIKESFVVAEDPMVIRTSYFSAPTAEQQATLVYDSVINDKSDSRYFAVYFPEKIEASFTDFSTAGGTVTFTAAKAANVVRRYSVRLLDTTTNTLVTIYDPLAEKNVTNYDTPSYYIYYPTARHVPSTHTFTLTAVDALDTTHTYELRLTAADDFGNTTAEYAIPFSVTGESFTAEGAKALKTLTVLNTVSWTGTSSYPRKQLITSNTDLSDSIFKFENISLTGKPKGFGVLLATGYAYDQRGFIVVYVDDMVLIYRSGSGTVDGVHATTGSSKFAAVNLIGSAKLAEGADSFTVRIKKESDSALAFYVDSTLVGTQTLVDGTCTIGTTAFNYKAAKVGLVPCYNSPTASGNGYAITLGTGAMTADCNISFDLSYATDYSK